MEVSVRELKRRLSEYLRRAQTGEEVVITLRGKPVARLAGLGSSGVKSDSPAVSRLRSAGWIRPAERVDGRSVDLPEPVPLPEGMTLSEAVVADRRHAGR